MATIATSLVALLLTAAPQAGQYFTITVVDEQTGRGVPLVELRTVNDVSYFTDSAGIVAFHEPGLINRKVFFHIRSHGYEFPKDGFGYRGKAVLVTEGGSIRLKIKRINIARRLYRVTGAGIYRDSVLVGHKTPIERPLLAAGVLGSDSVVNAVFRGKIYWFWGDTNRPGYPLGNFHVPGATSLLPDSGGLKPDVGVDLDYFLDENGLAKETARMPGEGPTWISALVALDDKTGRQRLFASYVKVRNFLEVYRRGLAEFDAETNRFEKLIEFDMDAPIFPSGHPFKHKVDGIEYIYYADPFPLVRVVADPNQVTNPAAYEAYTCLKEGTRLDRVRLDRADDGTLRYGWKKNTPPLGHKQQTRLIEAGKLEPDEALSRLKDRKSGKSVIGHRGSVYWNDYRQRWVMIATETGGTSPLGEIWYAEADAPEGPWIEATKIVTHQKYSFYNPKQHPMFDRQGGRLIYFEGTYTSTFSGNTDRTPRYDYNQIMYELDLSDPRLGLSPVPRPERDEHGFLVHTVTSPYQTGPTKIKVLLPDQWKKGSRCRILYVLPVEPGGGERWGNGLIEVEKNNLHNKHRLICVMPEFSRMPWYADHPTDAEIRQESYFLKVVVPLIDRSYPASAGREGRLLVGFSKSGWGAFSLLLRHPDVFAKAAAWDAPLMMQRPDKYGMVDVFVTQENFKEYRISALLKQRAPMLSAESRLIHFGYGNFREHHQSAHRLMEELKITHQYRDGPKRAHSWHGGWLTEAVEMLAGKRTPTCFL